MEQQLQQMRQAAMEKVAHASSTLDVARAPAARGAGDAVRMFGDVAPDVQLKMELLARVSASPETALPHVIALLVEGDAKRIAVIEAINTNDPLREQWHRTWEVLRR